MSSPINGDSTTVTTSYWLDSKPSKTTCHNTRIKGILLRESRSSNKMKNAKKPSYLYFSLIPLLFLSILLFSFLSHHLYRDFNFSTSPLTLSFSSPPPPSDSSPSSLPALSSLLSIESSNKNSSWTSSSLSTVSILIPDWQVMVIVSPETPPSPETNYTCLFPNGASSPARFSGEFPSHRGGTVFTCEFPERNRRKFPFLQPRLVSNRVDRIGQSIDEKELLRWNSLAYESFVTEHDVVLFVKGVNNHQGINRHPSDLNCVFGEDTKTGIRTPVTSSEQEVFRCLRPKLIDSVNDNSSAPIRVTLEIKNDTNNGGMMVVPSVAHYKNYERRMIAVSERKSLICACTMVYNVAKFLREWVTYHAAVGVEKFVLYDNDSNDDLDKTVRDLNRAGFDVRTVYWPWPKTQEAGFSHCALYSDHICQWVVYVDVDEFVLSPNWLGSSTPEPGMLGRDLLPRGTNPGRVGQVMVKCHEFGPSNWTVHPPEGVTQGYTCRRKSDYRHKSIVLLEAMHPSLLNVVHHFKLRPGYTSSQLGLHRAVVNHYKYQAWPEFRAKFRRRVSAYVVDWRQSVNLKSKDRTVGLGFEPVEPKGWAQRFCAVKDEKLKMLTRKWFGVKSSDLMAWQST